MTTACRFPPAVAAAACREPCLAPWPRCSRELRRLARLFCVCPRRKKPGGLRSFTSLYVPCNRPLYLHCP
eukprot:3951761-Prymnesium_polylepis.1